MINKQNIIVFTGGGTAGHVLANFPLIHYFQEKNWKIVYIGSRTGIEKDLVNKINITYFAISSGKLRRQLTLKNILMPYQVIKGIIQSYRYFHQLKPDVVFSKGGFVALPVVIAAWLNRIPVACHESDFSPGLTTRISAYFAKIIFVSFLPSTQFFSKKNKVIVSGLPLRAALFQGNRLRGMKYAGFHQGRPILLVIGGSLGAQRINQVIWDSLDVLLEHFQVIHICGKNKLNPQKNKQLAYCQLEYVDEALPDLFACADFFISRAGANTLYELLALRKPHLLIPLAQASRGDQLENAQYFAEKNCSMVLQEAELNSTSLMQKLLQLQQEQKIYQLNLAKEVLPDSVNIISEQLINLANKE